MKELQVDVIARRTLHAYLPFFLQIFTCVIVKLKSGYFFNLIRTTTCEFKKINNYVYTHDTSSCWTSMVENFLIKVLSRNFCLDIQGTSSNSLYNTCSVFKYKSFSYLSFNQPNDLYLGTQGVDTTSDISHCNLQFSYAFILEHIFYRPTIYRNSEESLHGSKLKECACQSFLMEMSNVIILCNNSVYKSSVFSSPVLTIIIYYQVGTV